MKAHARQESIEDELRRRSSIRSTATSPLVFIVEQGGSAVTTWCGDYPSEGELLSRARALRPPQELGQGAEPGATAIAVHPKKYDPHRA